MELPAAAARFKVVLCGRAGVGKTSLLHALDPTWRHGILAATVGADISNRRVQLPDGRAIELQVWDTAGLERYATPMDLVYRGADAVVFVYDITERSSFEAMPEVLGTALLACAAPFVIVIGNKADLVARRAVSVAEAEAGCVARCYTFLETSAHTRTNVDEMLAALATALASRILQRPPPPRPAVPPLDLAGVAVAAAQPDGAECRC
jgi:small GTP-binding protein